MYPAIPSLSRSHAGVQARACHPTCASFLRWISTSAANSALRDATMASTSLQHRIADGLLDPDCGLGMQWRACHAHGTAAYD